MARKREVQRNGNKSPSKEKGAKQNKPPSNEEENYASVNNQLAALGLTLREIPGDGNCLFRALGDQLEGHAKHHLKHRHDTVDYMRNHRTDFEPFVEDDIPFEKHVSNLGTPGTYAGNDAIVAFARLRGVTVVIHQLSTPPWQISGAQPSEKNVPELHIAFHNGDHYNSVRKMGDNSESPADIRMTSQQKSTFDLSSHKNGYTGTISGKNIDSDTYADLVMNIMEKTDCQDVLLIQGVLKSQKFDLNNTIKAILDCNMQQSISTKANFEPNSSSLWGSQGTGTRLFGQSSPEGNHGAKPRFLLHLTRKQRKEVKRSQIQNGSENGGDNSATAILPAIQDLKCLSI